MASRVVLVGVGRIASSHLRALENVASVETVVGVDPSPRTPALFRGAPLPIGPDLGAAVRDGADVVVVATPTDSHAAVVDAVRAVDAYVPILLEKPAAARRQDADRLLAAGSAVQVIFHIGFAPEVLWATGFYESAQARFGKPVGFEAWFGNPYANDRDDRAGSLANSWLDSGINALSVIGRFVVPAAVEAARSLADKVSTYEARFRLGPVDGRADGTIVTTWQAAADSQSVRLRFANGAELALDHVAGSATVYENGRRAEMFTRTDPRFRLDLQYANFYCDYFGAKAWQYPAGVSRDLHDLLFTALEAVP
jgi:predicted dehydrogenase